MGKRLRNHIRCCPLTFVGLEFHAGFVLFSVRKTDDMAFFIRDSRCFKTEAKTHERSVLQRFGELLISCARSTKVHFVLASSRHLVGILRSPNTVFALAFADVVQSLNSPFFPPHIGDEPGRAKEESRIACMLIVRTNQSKITRSQPRRLIGSF